MTRTDLLPDSARRTLVAASLVLGIAACGDDDGPTNQQPADGSTPPPGEIAPDAGTPPAQNPDSGQPVTPPPGDDSGTPQPADAGTVDPVFVTILRVWTQDDAFQYVKLSRTLDVGFSPDDWKTAREFAGYAGITVQDGKIIVGDVETPFVTKYNITSDLKWEQEGQPLNFSDYFMADADGLNDYYIAKKGADQLYFYGGSERTARLHYNLDQWKIVGAHEDSNLPTREGWNLRNMGNRTSVKGFKDAIVWPFTLSPVAPTVGVPESYLAVYDATSFAEKAVIASKCPDIRQSTLDEDGNYYFSTTGRSPLAGLYKTSAPNCLVKVKPDGTVDTSFGPAGEKDISALTGGLHGKNFRYLKGGKAVVNVLNPAKLTGANFDGPPQREVECQVTNCDDMPGVQNPDVWEHHVVDLATSTSKLITGYDPKHISGGDYRIYWEVDGRVIFMNYAKDPNDVNLAMYELNLDTAVVTLLQGATFQTETSGEWTAVERLR